MTEQQVCGSHHQQQLASWLAAGANGDDFVGTAGSCRQTAES